MTRRSGHLEDIDYFRARAIQEQLAAGRATYDEARKRHDELAMLYRFKVAMLSMGPDSWVASVDPEPLAEIS